MAEDLSVINTVPVELARYAFLVVLSRRMSGSVARSYLLEKTKQIYRARTAREVRELLDGPSKLMFDQVVEDSIPDYQTWPNVYLTKAGDVDDA